MRYLPRALETQVRSALRAFPALALTGPRRAGKTRVDAGLACHLLGIDTVAELDKSPFRGVLFEGFVASELAKAQLNAGARRELYFFRDEQGLEVDCLVPGRGGRVRRVECKASKTVVPAMVGPMLRLAEAFRRHRSLGPDVDLRLVHERPRAGTPTRAVAPGVRAQPWREFLAED